MSLPARSIPKRCGISPIKCRSYSAFVDGSIPPSKRRFIQESGTYPKGFVLASAHANVKPSNTTKDDVAIITSHEPCNAAAFFTNNKFRAAPVLVSQAILDHKGSGKINSVVINSGCANAVTGTQGTDDALKMADAVNEFAGGDPSERRALVMSTGVIGQRLPIDKILNVIPSIKKKLGDSHEHWASVAQAITTTDTFPKLRSRTFTLPSHPGKTYTIAGMSKGAGMIQPNLGTLLSVICTDAAIEHRLLKGLAKKSIARSFNSISIDGDTSTNDSVYILANGAASGPLIEDYHSDAAAEFQEVLDSFMVELAQLVVRDGEGATKFITIKVKGPAALPTNKQYTLQRIARVIANSSLVKTAMYGRDANWGRILCAIGNSYFAKDPSVKSIVGVSFGLPNGGRMPLVVKDQPVDIDEDLAKEVLDQEDVTIHVDMADGQDCEKVEYSFWTCDLSHEYVTINGDYRT